MSCLAARAASRTLRPSAAALVSSARALVAAGALAAALTSCAHAPVAPPATPPTRPGTPAVPATPPRPRPKPGYDGLVDSLASVDTSVLRGKKVVLDPGHGGYFTGCIGVGGFTEAEVNLSVALHLRELLVAAGAEVTLTRDRDRDYLVPSDSTLRFDLQKRVEIANAAHADLFVSIHHNADPGGLHDVNETQVYYKLGDEGPSYDLANDVMRSLARNVGIETVRLLPGNFYVVRGSEAPALLTESSHLTNPDVEARLRTGAARLLEAQALYVGVARYFARKVPVVERFSMPQSDYWPPSELMPNEGGLPLATGVNPVRFGAHVRGAFDRVELRVDGTDVPCRITNEVITGVTAAPLAAGPHRATLRATLAGEGSSRLQVLDFRVVRDGDFILEPTFASMSVTPTRNAMALRVRVLDQARLPAPDSVRIRVRVKRPSLLAPRDTVIIAREGVAWAYFHYPRPVDLIGGIAARVSLQPSFDFGDAEVSDDREPQSPTVIDTLLDPSDVDHGRSGFALQMPAGERLRDAPGTAGAYPAVQWINRDGFCALPPDSEGGMHAPQLPGFRTWGADTLFPPRYTAIAGGALWGKRIVLDPEGGGDDAAGIGRTGTRAATINLDVARALAAMLRAAGAEVALTREGDAAISEVERVQIAEGFRAERYLRIGHAAAPTVIGHYFSSAGGRRWGQSLAEMAVTLGLDSVRVADVAKYTLTQVSAVALYASLARIDDAAAEARLLEPGAARREAYALYAALLREFAADAKWTVQTFEARDDAGAPQGGAPVRLGGALVVAADAKGRVRYLATEQGPLQATFTLPGAAARVLLLDSPDARKTSFSR